MYKMQHLEVSGAVRHICIYIYIYVIRRLKVKWMAVAQGRVTGAEPSFLLRSPKVGGAIAAMLCNGTDSTNWQRLKTQANN